MGRMVVLCVVGGLVGLVGLVRGWETRLLHHFALLLKVSLSLIEALGVGVGPWHDGPVLLEVAVLVHGRDGQRLVHE
jgi:hypothetical protein